MVTADEEYYGAGGGKNAEIAVTLVARLLTYGSPGRVLDIGCGTGAILAALRGAATTLNGVDVSPWAVGVAQERLPEARISYADIEQGIPAEDASYDTVILADVIEHLRRPVELLQDVFRLLSPGGTLFLTTPNANSPLRYLRGRSWFGLQDSSHIIFYTSFTLLHLLQKCGFQIRYSANEGLTGSFADHVLRLARIGGTIVVVASRAANV